MQTRGHVYDAQLSNAGSLQENGGKQQSWNLSPDIAPKIVKDVNDRSDFTLRDKQNDVACTFSFGDINT